MNKVSLMNVPIIKGKQFKIKCKADAQTFITKCMNLNSEYTVVIKEDYAFVFNKDENGDVTLYERTGISGRYSYRIIASGKNGQINNFLNDYIWSIRKYINAKWFNN